MNMTWDDINAAEGNSLFELSVDEIDDVAGGVGKWHERIRTAAAVTVAVSAAASAGRALGYW